MQTTHKRFHFLCFQGNGVALKGFMFLRNMSRLFWQIWRMLLSTVQEKRSIFSPLCGEKKLKCITTGTEVDDVISALGQQSAEPLSAPNPQIFSRKRI